MIDFKNEEEVDRAVGIIARAYTISLYEARQYLAGHRPFWAGVKKASRSGLMKKEDVEKKVDCISIIEVQRRL